MICEFHKDCENEVVARVDIPSNPHEHSAYGLGVPMCLTAISEWLSQGRGRPELVIMTVTTEGERMVSRNLIKLRHKEAVSSEEA